MNTTKGMMMTVKRTDNEFTVDLSEHGTWIRLVKKDQTDYYGCDYYFCMGNKETDSFVLYSCNDVKEDGERISLRVYSQYRIYFFPKAILGGEWISVNMLTSLELYSLRIMLRGGLGAIYAIKDVLSAATRASYPELLDE